ncbi:MAG: hypothetical protein AAF541_10890 [Pseudomonadota bacterium]
MKLFTTRRRLDSQEQPRLGLFTLVTFGIWVSLFGCAESKPAATWELAAQGFYATAFSADAQLAVVGSMNHGASLWRVADKERLFNWSHETGEFTELVAADFSPDGSRAVTTDPRTLVLWDTNAGTALNYWTTPGPVLDVAVLNDNRHVLMGLKDHSAVLFDAVSGDYQQTLLHQGEVGDVAVTPDGQLALTGSDDYTAVLWRLNDGNNLHTFQHDNPVRAVAISKSGTYSFTAAQGDRVAIWNNSSGQMLHELHNSVNHGAICAEFSADERLLLVGYTTNKVILYDVSTGASLRTWSAGTKHPLRATGAAILKVAFGNQGNRFLAFTGDGRLVELRPS